MVAAWITLYNEKRLPEGQYRGELYDIGFDRPEAHVVAKDGRLYYAFYADRWHGPVELRGLGGGRYSVTDYWNDRTLGVVSASARRRSLSAAAARAAASAVRRSTRRPTA